MSGNRGHRRAIRLLPFAAAASRLQTPALLPATSRACAPWQMSVTVRLADIGSGPDANALSTSSTPTRCLACPHLLAHTSGDTLPMLPS